MAYERVLDYFRSCGLADRVHAVKESCATVQEAALAVGCEGKQIAKTMSFYLGEDPVLIVLAGDARVDNKKFKAQFGKKPRMIPWEEVETSIGHAPGGVCPFALSRSIPVYLDASLRRFGVVYPAAGSGNSFVCLSLAELESHSGATGWVDVASGWQNAEEL